MSVDGQPGDQGRVNSHSDRAAAVRSALRAAAHKLAEDELRGRSADQRAPEPGVPPPASSTPPPDLRAAKERMGEAAAVVAPASRVDRLLGIEGRDRRDRWLVLKSLEGQRVTVLAGFKRIAPRTGTLIISNDRRDGQPRSDPPSIVIDDGKRRWFPIAEVHSITDPADGAWLGGPW